MDGGQAWHNGAAEGFNGQFRGECLNAECRKSGDVENEGALVQLR